ncbi:hypothetical protein [Streptomyces bottropensis]|uniref:hypothetical protein n=1 Tax=Streptomyces bottropensis TaxID=42235 RepID=UPI00367FE138
MLSMPEQSAPDQQETDALLIAIEHELCRIAKQKREAKRERRRLLRARRAKRLQAIAQIGYPFLRAGLLLGGAVTFVIGIAFWVTGMSGSKALFETAIALWGLAAVVPKAQ